MGHQSVWEKSRTQQVRPGVSVSGGEIIQRDTANLIPGENVSISAVDNPVTKRVDVTISATGSGGIPDAPSDGTTYGRNNAAWAAITGGGGGLAGYAAKTAAYTVVAGDRGYFIDCSGTFTLALTAAATLGAGFSFTVVNSGTGVVSIDPDGSESIATWQGTYPTINLRPGSTAILGCNGSAWTLLNILPKNVRTLDEEILADAPTCYYKLNEAVGATSVIDYGSAGANLTYDAGPTLQASKILPTSDDSFALLFGTGGGAQGSVNPTGVSVPSGNVSFCTLFTNIRSLASTSGYATFFALSNGSTSTYAFDFCFHNGKLALFMNTSAGGQTVEFTMPSVISESTYLLHWVKDGAGKKLSAWINGKSVGTQNFSADTNSSISTPLLTLGKSTGTETLSGMCGHMALFYGAKLTEARIVAHAKAAGLYCA